MSISQVWNQYSWLRGSLQTQLFTISFSLSPKHTLWVWLYLVFVEVKNHHGLVISFHCYIVIATLFVTPKHCIISGFRPFWVGWLKETCANGTDWQIKIFFVLLLKYSILYPSTIFSANLGSKHRSQNNAPH